MQGYAPKDKTALQVEMAEPTFQLLTPMTCQAGELDEFVALVSAGGEVDAYGFRDRVLDRGVALSFAREDGRLLGVGGLKRPLDAYRRRVAVGSHTALSPSDFPYELGWVFLVPEARGRKLSFPLCAPLLAAANGDGIFATSRADNEGMHATLRKLGFTRTGSEWPSRQNKKEGLALFLRRPP